MERWRGRGEDSVCTLEQLQHGEIRGAATSILITAEICLFINLSPNKSSLCLFLQRKGDFFCVKTYIYINWQWRKMFSLQPGICLFYGRGRLLLLPCQSNTLKHFNWIKFNWTALNRAESDEGTVKEKQRVNILSQFRSLWCTASPLLLPITLL